MEEPMIDFTTEFGKQVEQRLLHERVIWLTTVGANGTPQPNPVWFLWQDGTVLVYTQPTSVKIRNLTHSRFVALNFNSDEYGGNVAIITGEARIEPGAPPASQVPAYIEKYRAGIADINMTPESFARDYSVPIRIFPHRLRGF
jgi:PPOX class probable F420-dependent enzyme